MPYTVINKFMDLQDKKTKYNVGDQYPQGDKKVTEKRIKELSSVHPKYKRAFIEEVTEKPSPKK